VAAPVDRALYRLEGPFDIVYADPPYDNELPLQVFRLLLDREYPRVRRLLEAHSAMLPVPPAPEQSSGAGIGQPDAAEGPEEPL